MHVRMKPTDSMMSCNGFRCGQQRIPDIEMNATQLQVVVQLHAG